MNHIPEADRSLQPVRHDYRPPLAGNPRQRYGYPDSWLGIDRRRDMLEEVLDRLTAIEARLADLAARDCSCHELRRRTTG